MPRETSRVIKISFVKPGAVKAGALAVFAQQGPILTPAAVQVDKVTGGTLAKALKASRFNGDSAEVLDVIAPAGTDASRVVLTGLGGKGKADAASFETIGGSLVARLQTSGETTLTIMMDQSGDHAVSQSEAAAALAAGARLRAYRFDQYRTKETASKKPSLAKLVIMTAEPKAAEALFAKASAVIDGVYLTRDLVSEPANILFPKSFAERIRKLTALGVDVEVLGEKEMKRLGMGSLLGVSQGSAHEPQLVIMRWDGTGPAKRGVAKAPPVCFIGKGVTFDTGGISIKPAAGMEEMKWDMGGAGAVTGALHALAARKAKAHVVGVVALVENMPSGTAQRPGDVVTSMSGQTIEVINTDAEGRLILCDAMTYAQNRFKPKVMIDLATLTGAMIIALGHEHAGIFANDDGLADELLAAGKASGDKLWRLPLGDAYDKLIASQIADMKNVGPREGGSITAAQFLKRFVQDGVRWAHLDIAGMVWASKDSALFEKGATGYGVRLLDRFVASTVEER
jgi:leucyl aminopeptidase